MARDCQQGVCRATLELTVHVKGMCWRAGGGLRGACQHDLVGARLCSPARSATAECIQLNSAPPTAPTLTWRAPTRSPHTHSTPTHPQAPHSLPDQDVVPLLPAVLQGGIDQALPDAARVGRPPHLDLRKGGGPRGGGGGARGGAVGLGATLRASLLQTAGFSSKSGAASSSTLSSCRQPGSPGRGERPGWCGCAWRRPAAATCESGRGSSSEAQPGPAQTTGRRGRPRGGIPSDMRGRAIGHTASAHGIESAWRQWSSQGGAKHVVARSAGWPPPRALTGS